MKFSEFYGNIRKYFALNTAQYDEFKRQESGHDKLVFILNHCMVQKSLKNLVEQSASGNVRRDVAVTPFNVGNENMKIEELKKALGKTTSQYPQMSGKVAVKNTKRKGRFLVAKERINAGSCDSFYLINIIFIYLRNKICRRCFNCGKALFDSLVFGIPRDPLHGMFRKVDAGGSRQML